MSRGGPRYCIAKAYAEYFDCAAKKVRAIGAHNLQACKDDATRRVLLGIGLRFDPQEKEQPTQPGALETFFNDKQSSPRKAKPVADVDRMMALAERRRA